MSKISHILLKNPVVVPTGTKLSEAVQLMKKNNVASLLVSRNDRLAGIVSVVDIMCSIEGREQDIAVDKVMHSPEFTIDSDKWLTDALEMFRCYNATHIAVVENGETIGIIRAEDILHTYRFKNEENGELIKSGNPCDWDVRYYSVIGFGKAFFIEDIEEKAKALKIITEHYSGNSFEFQKNSIDKVIVIRVEIEGITGKKSG